jgi:hypothetical protein
LSAWRVGGWCAGSRSSPSWRRSAPTAGTARPIARAAACDALGAARRLRIFAHRERHRPERGVHERPDRRRGDVTLAAGAVNGSPSPAIVAGRTSSPAERRRRQRDGGVRYGRSKDVASNFTITAG